ncbi:MAG: NrfD/PsrC family molybdoenzyme membrane anchor subunit, partial [Planctomycetota bacterium]
MGSDLVYNIQPGPYWDWRIALDLFFGGAGVGALLFGVMLDVFFKGRYQRICQTAAWLSPILVVLGLGFLLLELGRPLRLLLTFVHFAPTSPLWWGGIFQTALVLGSVAHALKWRSSVTYDRGRRLLGYVLAPVAVVVGAYHGLLLALIPSRPLWNTGPTVVAAIICFAATGIAAVMLTHLVRMKIAGRLVEGERLNEFMEDMMPVRTV